MANPDRDIYGRHGARTAGAVVGEVDLGLRSYMLRVFNYMALGLGVTAVAAFFINSFAVSETATAYQLGNGRYLTEFGATLYGSALMWIVFLAPLGIVFFLSARIHALSLGAAQTTFWIFAALMGVSLSSIFIVYTPESIFQVFMITAITFGAMSLYGYTTKRDLTSWGSFLFMGLIGIIIAIVVNWFIGSAALGFAISVIGVLVFVGFTAYDTQKIKEMYYAGDDNSVAGRKSIMGALRLYLDFLNIFLFLLYLFGGQRQ
jgi:hypothetical protein